jgi:ankyrin repeat protein
MIQPHEFKSEKSVTLSNRVISTTAKVWNILVASRGGDLERVKRLVGECPELIYAQYNYTPPIHFAVREGHLELTKYLLNHGAHDPDYKIYPFLESLVTTAKDRNYDEIAMLLEAYNNGPTRCKFRGDNGEINYNWSDQQIEFQKVVNENDLGKTQQILTSHPEFALDENFFWSEGILMMPAKVGNYEMIELLMRYGAKVPLILKWAQFYYFERYDSAAFMMEKGMNPNVMSWHHVTLLHDMAQKGDLQKAQLLIEHGAEINSVEEEYQSTPLGMAARWGQTEMVEYLLARGADPAKAGAAWATPLAWAISKERVEIEKILRSCGAK